MRNIAGILICSNQTQRYEKTKKQIIADGFHKFATKVLQLARKYLTKKLFIIMEEIILSEIKSGADAKCIKTILLHSGIVERKNVITCKKIKPFVL